MTRSHLSIDAQRKSLTIGENGNARLFSQSRNELSPVELRHSIPFPCCIDSASRSGLIVWDSELAVECFRMANGLLQLSLLHIRDHALLFLVHPCCHDSDTLDEELRICSHPELPLTQSRAKLRFQFSSDAAELIQHL
jgi:hypothetical protein